MEFIIIAGLVAFWAILVTIDLVLEHRKFIGTAVAFTAIAQVVYFAALFSALMFYPMAGLFALAAAIAALLLLLTFHALVAPKLRGLGYSLSLSRTDVR
jgi:hypothetical protein